MERALLSNRLQTNGYGFANAKNRYEKGENTELMGRGRHDPCVLPRAVPIVEAMTALVLIDHKMKHHAQCLSFQNDGL